MSDKPVYAGPGKHRGPFFFLHGRVDAVVDALNPAHDPHGVLPHLDPRPGGGRGPQREQGVDIGEIDKVILSLRGPLPERLRDHDLVGEYQGHR